MVRRGGGGGGGGEGGGGGAEGGWVRWKTEDMPATPRLWMEVMRRRGMAGWPRRGMDEAARKEGNTDRRLSSRRRAVLTAERMRGARWERERWERWSRGARWWERPAE